jgi:hypothetical protein
MLNDKEDYLHGFVGFSDTDKFDPVNPWKFPVQRFLWWDYSVKPGDTVQYSVVPVTGPNKDNLTRNTALASPLTEKIKITGQSTPHMSAYFNKGIVAAQWVSQALATQPRGQKITNVITRVGSSLRNELSGLLRTELLSLLAEAKKAGEKIFAALYELNDPELIRALVSFGKNCNLILANGAFKPPDNDENKQERADLKTKINVFDRIVKLPHFDHNKFVVFCDGNGQPKRVLTGSTNWTSTGLCTQANNAVIIDDPAVAADFLEAWNRIHAAGNDYPPTLAAANSSAKTFEVDGGKITPWFVPTQHGQDLEYARKLINGAKEGILFLFFNPGTFQPDSAPDRWTLLQNILNRHNQENNAYYNPNLYLRGVVNQEIPFLTNDGGAKGTRPLATSLDPTAATQPVALYTNGVEPPQRLSHDVMVPANIKDKFHNWVAELLGASMVNIHSKVIVCDPFGENPVVMTGSHNLGFKASSENDDNLVIIEGNKPLAAAYAINIIAIFHTYRWNSHVEAHRQDPNFWHGLVDNDQWQKTYLKGDELAELKFWIGTERVAPAMQPATPRAPRKVPAPRRVPATRQGKRKPYVAPGAYLPQPASAQSTQTAPVPPLNGGQTRKAGRRNGRKTT